MGSGTVGNQTVGTPSMTEQDLTLNNLLRDFVNAVTLLIPADKTYTDKTDDIRVKWIDRGTQKAIKIYAGRMKQIDLATYFDLPSKKAQRDSGSLVSHKATG